ncbi:MAG TPA: hypothetical protein VES60_11730 [Nakamurella sp.]|nr:hypothetical protein [Nakamurella sp.]
MDQSGATEWSVFTDPDVGLLVRFPLRTPTGALVDRAFDPVPAWRLHLASDDGAVYVEAMLLRDLTPRVEYLRHLPYLLERFSPDAVSRPTATRSARTRSAGLPRRRTAGAPH